MTTDIQQYEDTQQQHDRDRERKRALSKALNIDPTTPQGELAIGISKQYGLDLMLRHLVLVDGKPYITRDGLLHVAHRSGMLDGIEVTEPEVKDVGGGKFWVASAAVYRKDMSRPFRYTGRYPVSGKNKQFAPEMATKVAEVMALRRAFDVSAPVVEERWDTVPPTPPTITPSLQETVQARQAEITSGRDLGAAPVGSEAATAASERASAASEEPPPPADHAGAREGTTRAQLADDDIGGTERTPEPDPDAGRPTPAPHQAPDEDPPPSSGATAMPEPPPTAAERCTGFSEEHGGRCSRAPGHKGNHKASEGTWR